MVIKISELTNYPQLKNWILTKDKETGCHYLYGEIYNDERYCEGYRIPSRRIIDVNDHGFEYFIINGQGSSARN